MLASLAARSWRKSASASRRSIRGRMAAAAAASAKVKGAFIRSDTSLKKGSGGIPPANFLNANLFWRKSQEKMKNTGVKIYKNNRKNSPLLLQDCESFLPRSVVN